MKHNFTHCGPFSDSCTILEHPSAGVGN